MQLKQSSIILQGLDYITISLYLTLVALGWLAIYSVGFLPESEPSLFSSQRTTSQMIWLGIALTAALAILLLDTKLIKRASPLLYVLMVLLLILTIFISRDIKGSHSWIIISEGVNIQPAEFAKVTTTMMMAWWCSRYEFNIKKHRQFLITFLIFTIPMLIIILQSETGSALVFLSFVLVLYREGLSGAVPAFGIFSALLFILVLRFSGIIWDITHAAPLLAFLIIYIFISLANWMTINERRIGGSSLLIAPTIFAIYSIASLFKKIEFSQPALISLILLILTFTAIGIWQQKKGLILIAITGLFTLGLTYGIEYFFENIMQPHQQNRILVSLGMKDDPSGAGYNVTQSLIAIGSGGLSGKGFLQGTQTKLSYVPEQETDFIFCTIAEEFGFIGASIVILIFLILLMRIIHIAERQTTDYARIYGYSVASIIFFHLFVNIGMVLGLVPVIGIPLPFFSYGGSSLLSFTILLFILLRLDRSNIRKHS